MTDKIDNIQILRAIAALGVVVVHTQYHIGPLKMFGGSGVDIFFAISGFIMAMICAGNGRDFLRKRLIRIVPLYWAVTIISFLILITHPSIDPALKRDAAALCKSLLFFPYLENDHSIGPLVPPGWSLNYEMFFYVILAIGIWTTRKRHGHAGFGYLLVLLAALRLLPQTFLSMYYSNPLLLEFLGGFVAYKIYVSTPYQACVRLRPMLYSIIIGSFCFIVWYEGTRYYLNDGTAGNRLGLAVPAYLILQTTVLLSKSGRDIRWRPGVLIGDASYSLYLTHLFVIVLFKRLVVPRLPLMIPTQLLGMLTVLVLATTVAIAVHKYVDKPVYTYLSRILLGRAGASTPTNPT